MKKGIYLFLWMMFFSLSTVVSVEALPYKPAKQDSTHAPAKKSLSKKEKKSYKKRLKKMRSKLRRGKKLSKAEKIGMYIILGGLGVLTTGAIMYFASITGTGATLLLIGFVLGFIGGIIWFLGSLFRRKRSRKDRKSKRKK